MPLALFGIAGALLASPIAGVLQALLIAIWGEWRAAHPTQFQKAQDNAVEQPEAVEERAAAPDARGTPGNAPSMNSPYWPSPLLVVT